MADHPHGTHESGDHPKELSTVEARQGTGPRAMVSVLTISMLLAAVAGTAILAYFLA
jgi:hypothetical protein